MNNLVFHPTKSKPYVYWMQYLSLVSIFQSFIYSILISFSYERTHGDFNFIIIALIIVEFSYVLELILE